MPSRNVAVRKDVYDALQKEKRGDESFTMLFLRLMNQRGPFDELRGSWPDRAAGSDTRDWLDLRYGRTRGRQ